MRQLPWRMLNALCEVAVRRCPAAASAAATLRQHRRRQRGQYQHGRRQRGPRELQPRPAGWSRRTGQVHRGVAAGPARAFRAGVVYSGPAAGLQRRRRRPAAPATSQPAARSMASTASAPRRRQQSPPPRGRSPARRNRAGCLLDADVQPASEFCWPSSQLTADLTGGLTASTPAAISAGSTAVVATRSLPASGPAQEPSGRCWRSSHTTAAADGAFLRSALRRQRPHHMRGHCRRTAPAAVSALHAGQPPDRRCGSPACRSGQAA